jgi:hypothetical protein
VAREVSFLTDMSDPHSPGTLTDDGADRVATIASPLPYLFAEERRGDRQAREGLFLTFNADLGYFERTVLGVTQSAGARITVIGDGRVSAPDPRAARNAGTRYLHGLAVSPTGAAFHPKVVVLAGPERAVVAIGSGNLSSGGWHLNQEIWTVILADRDGCPAIVGQVADWLRTLPRLWAITPHAASAAERAANCLQQLAQASSNIIETGHQLADSSERPIIDQLPRGPLTELLLYAPFHDERAEALEQLIVQLSPEAVRLAVQSGARTVIQPSAVAQVVRKLGVALYVTEDAGTAYRHGKLIVGVRPDGSRWALTGSPNLSARALLRAANGGGNIEVAVITPLTTITIPSDSKTTLAAVQAQPIDNTSPDRPAPSIIVIAASTSVSGLLVTLAAPASQPVRVLTSAHNHFDTWDPTGVIPVGATEHLFPDAHPPAGSRLCAEWHTSGTTTRSPVIFVADPELILRRHGEHLGSGRHAVADPVNLITDPRLMEIWAASLGQLASSNTAAAVPRVTGSAVLRGESDTRPGTGLRTDGDNDNWLSYIDDANGRLGSPVVQLALGGFRGLREWLPAAHLGLEAPDDRIIDDSRRGLEDDENAQAEGSAVTDLSEGRNSADATDVAAGHDDAGGPDARIRIPDQGGQPEAEKKRGRRVLTRLVTDVGPRAPAIDRVAIIILLLCAIEARVWADPLGEDGWLKVVGAAMSDLSDCEIPQQLRPRAASVAALAIYRMHEYRPTHARTAETLCYEKTARDSEHLLADADPDLVADFAEPFTNINGYPVDPDAVMHVVSVIVEDDPLIEAKDILESSHPTWEVNKTGSAQLLIHGDFRVPFLAAAEAVDAVHRLDVVAVTAVSKPGIWAIAARRGNDLIRIEHQHGPVTWRHYHLSNLVSASGIARDQELANRVRVSHGPLNQGFAGAHQIVAAAGMDPTSLPPR